jgi:hypothetical protein
MVAPCENITLTPPVAWFRFTLFEIETNCSYNDEIYKRQVDGVNLYHVWFCLNAR